MSTPGRGKVARGPGRLVWLVPAGYWSAPTGPNRFSEAAPTSLRRRSVSRGGRGESAQTELARDARPVSKPGDFRCQLQPGSKRDKLRCDLEEHVVAGGLADADAAALTGERADHHAGLVGGRGEVEGPLAERQPHEVALRVGQAPALVGEGCGHPATLRDDGLDPLEQGGLLLERGDGGGLRDRRDPERKRAGAHGRGDLGVGHDVADAEPGQPVGLGEGPHRHHVGPGAHQVDAVEPLVVGEPHELAVGLVDDHHDVRRHPVEERLELGPPDRRAGRVVGAADDDHLGAAGDGVGHRVEVVARVGVERHLHRRRARDRHRDRVGLEGPPGVDDLVAALAERLQQVVEHGHRSGAGGEPLDGYVETGRQRVVQLGAGHVRVAVHPAGRLHGGLQDAGQRRVRVLVRGELVGGQALTRSGRLAGDVGGDVADRRPHLGGHAVNIRPSTWAMPLGRSVNRLLRQCGGTKGTIRMIRPGFPSRTLEESVVPGGELSARRLQ